MAKFCVHCGAALQEEAAFCPSCGRAVGDVVSPSGAQATTTGLQENVAGLLCYLVGWVTGLIFFLIDKRPFVRFHAMQSIITFGALNVFYWILIWSGWFGGMIGWAFISILSTLLGVLALVCWIVCMVKAYQGERFHLPLVGQLAENYSK